MKLNINIKQKSSDSIIKKYYEYKDFDFINKRLSINIQSLYSNIRYGNFITNIEFIKSIVGSYNSYKLQVNSISTNRYEIELKLSNGNMLNTNYSKLVNDFTDLSNQYAPNFLKTKNYKFKYIYLEFFDIDEKYQIINFIKTNNNTIVFKLRSELSENIKVDDFVVIYEKLYADLQKNIKIVPLNNSIDVNVLDKPNLDLKINTTIQQYSNYNNYNDIVENDLIETDFFNESLKGINLNIDFTDFSNFIFFSSIYERIVNFKYKMQLIENYTTIIDSLPYYNTNVTKYQNIIDSIIKSFDMYEHYLYYEDVQDYTYPKDVNGINLSLTDTNVINWFETKLEEAQLFDKNNKNLLVKLVPEYIYSNEYNVQYLKFLSLIGHHFDIIWLYIVHMGDLKTISSNISTDLSKKLIYHTLSDFGWKPISNFENTNLNSYLYKEEHDNIDMIYASDELVSRKQIDLEYWKRLLDNITYLYKTKGTKESIRGLLNIYGIPSTTLLIQEYGGKHPYYDNNYFDYDKFAYCLDKTSNNTSYITVDNIKFRGFEIRFKLTNENDNIILISNDNTIKIWTDYNESKLKVEFETYGSTYNYEIEEEKIYNGEWWNLNFSYNADLSNTDGTFSDFDYVENIVYNLILTSHIDNKIYVKSYKNIIFTGVNDVIDELNDFKIFNIGTDFTGYLQELRFWNCFIGFKHVLYHTLAPTTISTCDVENIYNDLIVRIPLGTDLNSYNHSVTTVLNNQNPSRNTSISISFNEFDNKNNYLGFVEKYYHIVPDISNNHANSKKIRYKKDEIITCQSFGDLFTIIGSFNNSFNNSFQRYYQNYQDNNNNVIETVQLQLINKTLYEYNVDENYKLGVYFSVANQVNESIYDFFGDNNIDNYIGDSNSEYMTSYKLLDNIINKYQQQYNDKYDVWSHLKMVKQYTKSIFYHLAQLVPIKTTNVFGYTVENDIIHRKKIKYLKEAPNITCHNYKTDITTTDDNSILFDRNEINFEIDVNLKWLNVKQYYIINNNIILSNRDAKYVDNYMVHVNDNIFIKNLQSITIIESDNINEISSDTDANEPVIIINNITK